MKNLIVLLLLANIICSCKRSNLSNGISRPVFDAHEQQVITTFSNRKQLTMCILYGDAAARKNAFSGYKPPPAGARYTLVVYKQANDKYWYGAHINGEIKSIETFTAGPGSSLTYKLERGSAATDSLGHVINKADRIGFIFSHELSIFP